jgi:hypothetical protein
MHRHAQNLIDQADRLRRNAVYAEGLQASRDLAEANRLDAEARALDQANPSPPQPEAPMNHPTEIDLICQRQREAKAREEQARTERMEAEDQLIALVGAKEEGTTTHKTEWFKVQTTGKLNRSLIPEALAAVQSAVPQSLYEQVIRYHAELSLSGLHAVEKANPDLYRVFTGAIITKPAKIAVSVEVL